MHIIVLIVVARNTGLDPIRLHVLCDLFILMNDCV